MLSELIEKPQTILDCPAHVELSRSLNRWRGDKVRIFAQVCGDNIKKLPALNLLMEARDSGRLEGVHTLVEGSSGNMALALGLLAPAFGIKEFVAITRADIAAGKLDPLRLSGIKWEFTTETGHQPSAIQLAREMGTRPGYLNLAQYENEANPRAFEKWLGPRIWQESGGKVSLVCCGLGTTGTSIGLSRYFKKASPKCKIVGVMCAPGNAVPGVRSEARLREIRLPWRTTLDATIMAQTKESFVRSRELWWETGYMVGPSSGFALSGLLRFIESHKSAGTLDNFRNDDGEVYAVFVCPDLAYSYFDKYSTYLDAEDFVI